MVLLHQDRGQLQSYDGQWVRHETYPNPTVSVTVITLQSTCGSSYIDVCSSNMVRKLHHQSNAFGQPQKSEESPADKPVYEGSSQLEPCFNSNLH